MAIQSNVYFVGRMGNVVGSTRMGTPYFRYQPERINQSEATKQSGITLGKASKIGAAFRGVFEPVLPQPKDRDMQNDFTGVIKKWLQTNPFEKPLPATVLPFIKDFNFNLRSLIRERLRLPLALKTDQQEQLVLRMSAFVPDQKIDAPAYTKTVNMYIIAATYSIASFSTVDRFQIALSIAYNHNIIPAQSFTIPYQLPSESVTLVLAALQYSKGAKERKR
jgi:hypothetical protein